MQYFQYIVGTLAVRRSTLLLKVLTGMQCSTAEAVRARKGKKQGAATLKDGLQRRFLRNGRRLSAKPTIKLPAVLYTAAAGETIWCNNSTHWDVQPTIALSAVLCCRSSESKSDQSRHLTLLGPESRSVRQTNQAISRCCVVDRETLS